MKAYPTYKPSGIDWISEIPSHWDMSKLKFHVDLVLGKMLTSSCPTTGKYTLEKYLKSRNVAMLHLANLDELDEMWFSDVEKEQYKLNEGDVIMNEGGDIGKVTRWIPQEYDCYIQNSVHKLSPKNSVSQSFLAYFLAATSFSGYFWSIVSQISIAHLTKEKLSNTPLLIPSKEEQEVIAAYLDAMTTKIDALTAEKQAQVDGLRSYRTSLITEAVTHGLKQDAKFRYTTSEFISQIPEHWSLDKFKYQAQIKSNLVHPEDYSTYPQISPDMIEKETGRLIGYKTVEDAGIISDNHLFYRGQIVYSKIRPNLNKLIIAPFDGLCSADMYPIETSNDIRFFKYLMLSSPFVDQVSAVISDRVKMPKINQEEMGELLVPIPPLSEQQEVARFLDEKTSKIDETIVELEEQLKELAEYKKAVITEAVTGKVDVRNWKPKE